MTGVHIGIVGRAGSGKDTAAEYLTRAYGLKHLSLASPLKEFCEKAFGFSHKQVWGPSELRNEESAIDWDLVVDNINHTGLQWVKFLGGGSSELASLHEHVAYLRDYYPETISVRVVLQHMGTEFARYEFGNDVWINFLLRKAAFYVKDGVPGIVVSDVRFLNEMEGIKKAPGKLVRVDREHKTLASGIVNHPSEGACDSLPCSYFHSVINNNRTIQDMYNALDVFMACQHD